MTKMRKRFDGEFDAISKMGVQYCNNQRFKPLSKQGKPLWEFKEHDHRLYCARIATRAGKIVVILLDGWVKDKEGRTQREQREIDKALQLYGEFLDEVPEEKHELLGNG